MSQCVSDAFDAHQSHGGFTTTRILISPTVAKRILDDTKIRNRRINPVRVKYFVMLMKSGQFLCTHQGIALDIDGNIVDGQHRLMAVVESKCSVYMMVSKGVPFDTIPVVDCGQPRTLSHRLTLAGVDFGKSEVAIARILEYGIVAASQSNLGIEEAKRILYKYEDAIRFASEITGCGVLSPIAAVIARAYYTQDPKKLKRFVEVYKTECPLNDTETAPLKLKRAVLKYGSYRGANGQEAVNQRRDIYNLTEAALYRYLKGERVSSLMASEKEHFPIPC